MIGTWPPGRPFVRPIRAIVIHHSATADSGTLSWGAIERYHVDENGWDAVGYHAGAEMVRDTYQVLLGRPVNRTGAHVGTRAADRVPWNHATLGFCFVGNYDAEEPPLELLEVAAHRWIVPTMASLGLSVRDLVPHRELDPRKSCPGRLFDMDRLRWVCSSIQGG